MNKVHVWIEDPVELEGIVTVGATVEHSGKRIPLWYKVPAKFNSLITESSDSFLLATIFIAMREKKTLHIHGEISPSLARNLEEFQAIWSCWKPERYQSVEIFADVEKESPQIDDTPIAISAFSGGVDSCFTAFRHAKKLCGRRSENLQAGLLIHGFDIALDRPDFFNNSVHKSQLLLDSIGVDLLTVATNFRSLGQDWEDSFAAAAASCLTLFKKKYSIGLFGSGAPYQALVTPWVSHPASAHLLSSRSFEFILDGSEFSRIEKVGKIADWAEARKYLRVCWEGSMQDRNCGKCRKCLHTILYFRAVGGGFPECFDEDISDLEIAAISESNLGLIERLERVLTTAEANSLTGSWIQVLRKSVKRNRRNMKVTSLIEQQKKKLKQIIKSSSISLSKASPRD